MRWALAVFFVAALAAYALLEVIGVVFAAALAAVYWHRKH